MSSDSSWQFSPQQPSAASSHVPGLLHVRRLSIPGFAVLRGSIRRRDLDIALNWAPRNKEVLENEWQRLNGE